MSEKSLSTNPVINLSFIWIKVELFPEFDSCQSGLSKKRPEFGACDQQAHLKSKRFIFPDSVPRRQANVNELSTASIPLASGEGKGEVTNSTLRT